jgi:hypothetical protein
MRKVLSIMAVSLGLASFTTPARADIAVGAGVGTLGYGLHVATSLTDFVAIRFNANFGEMDVPGVGLLSDSFGGIEYDMDASFGTYGLIADFHLMALSPIGAGLVVSGGMYYNNNEFTLTADPLVDVDIGGTTVTGGSARVISEFSFDTKWAPYLGLGYDGTFQGFVPVSFFFTGGVMFQDSPSVTVSESTGLVSPADLAAEAAEIEADSSSLKYYPVLAMGVTISF